MAYTVYKYTDEDTLFEIANYYKITVSELIRINNISQPCDPKPINVPELSGEIIVPYIETGNESFENRDRVSVDTLRQQNRRKANAVYVQNQESIGHSVRDKCYIIIGYDNSGTYGQLYYFPCFPDSFSDSCQSNFTSQNPLGRSEPFQIYQNSGPRVVNVSFKMHREMAHVTSISKLVAAVQSTTYPRVLGSSDTVVPKVKLVIGNACSIVGVIEGNVNVEYSDTINKNWEYNMVTLSFSVTECTGNPKSQSDIINNYLLNTFNRDTNLDANMRRFW